MAKSLHRRGYGISVRDRINPGDENGLVLHAVRLVLVKEREIVDMCYTLAHELGHLVYLGEMYAVGEIKADTFAHHLLRRFGVDKEDESADYVLSWLTYEEISDEDWVFNMQQAANREAKREARLIRRLLGRCPK